MPRVARTTTDALVEQRNESRLRELDRRVTTVLAQDVSWPRGLVGYVSSSTNKYPITAETALLSLTAPLYADRSYSVRAAVSCYVDGVGVGLVVPQLYAGGVAIARVGKALQPNGWVESTDLEEVYLPVADGSVFFQFNLIPDLGKTYGVFAASNYGLWMSITDTGPQTSNAAIGVVY